MEPNAWDRAREAIARASERDDAVVTPDTAVSPFDASSTMVIPQAALQRHPGAPHPDTTQRLGPGAYDPRLGAPAPRPAASGEHGYEHGYDHAGYATPAPRSTHLPPEPPTRPVEVSDPRGAHARVAGERPATAPFSAVEARGGGDGDETPPDLEEARLSPRRPWWRRLFGR